MQRREESVCTRGPGDKANEDSAAKRHSEMCSFCIFMLTESSDLVPTPGLVILRIYIHYIILAS